MLKNHFTDSKQTPKVTFTQQTTNNVDIQTSWFHSTHIMLPMHLIEFNTDENRVVRDRLKIFTIAQTV